MRIQFTRINATEIGVVLEAMPSALRNKAMRPMVETISSIGAKKMKGNLKRSLQRAKKFRGKKERWRPSGALMASIGVRRPVKVMKNGSSLFGGFGVRRSTAFAKNKLRQVRRNLERKTTFGFRKVKRGSVTLATKPRRTGPLEVRPSKYAHLVERGHGGPIPSRPYPFAEPTYLEMKSVFQTKAPQILREKWPKVLAAESRRLRRKTAKMRGF